jgi:hypothetical protein
MSESFEQLKSLVESGSAAALGPERRAGALPESELDHRIRIALKRGNHEPDREALIRSLILLWHDHLEASHALSQDIPTADGSYVHGIMHRREPDSSNAKYWFHRVGSHPIFPKLAVEAQRLARTEGSKFSESLTLPGSWDPFAFIDLCEEARRSRNESRLEFCRRIQRCEFLLLLEYFTR